MYAKVTREFVDKNTNEIRKVGSVFECSEVRFAEIQAISPRLAMRVEMSPEDYTGDLSDSTADMETDGINAPEKPLEMMSVRELREYADKAHKLTFSHSTTKAEMIMEIRRFEK